MYNLASNDVQKISDLADEYNGGPAIFGPYFVASVELEDVSQQVVQTDAYECLECAYDQTTDKNYCSECGRKIKRTA